MKVKSLKFNGVRNFEDETIFDFTEAKPLTTVSGKNGSGKTTVFKSLLLCQKAFFVKQIVTDEVVSLTTSLNYELKKYFTREDAFMEVYFNFQNEIDFNYSFRLSCTGYHSQYVEWDIDCTEDSLKKIKTSWSLSNPSEIIVFVDSDKHFFEKNISYDSISVRSQTRNQLLIDSILNPENTFTNIYQSLVNDYIKERLVPERPRADIYLIPTKVFVQYLLPNITISNFSGQQLVNQFVLLSKTSKNERSTYFDIRNFSSGEKALFYVLLFINYIQRIGLLIIDEPENHFHEELLVKFIRLLNDIVTSSDNVAIIQKVAKQIGFSLSKTNVEDFKKYYGNYRLSNIFLLTHSKNLIYNNFTDGSNYYLDGCLKSISYDNYEKTLREIGLSSVYSRVLFVEGIKDTEYLDLFFNENNIKVHALEGSGAVVDTYKRILQIKSYLRDYHFCFLIDRDTKSDKDIEKIEDLDSAFFKSHFHVLERHEFENYLLDADLFKKVIDTHADINEDIKKLSSTKIKEEIKGMADKEKIHVIRKSVQVKNWMSFSNLRAKFSKKDLPVSSSSEYQSFINSVMDANNFNILLKDEFMKNYSSVESNLSDENWSSNWELLCDGKIVFKKAIEYYSNYTGVKTDRFASDMKKQILKSGTSYEVKRLIDAILLKFR